MQFDTTFLDSLLDKAQANERLRQNFDLRTTPNDTSQRMLNALMPGTLVPIHQHADTTETVVCLRGRLDEIIYEANTHNGQTTYTETQRISLCPAQGLYGCQIPQGAWHTVEVIEPSSIFEAKDGAYKG